MLRAPWFLITSVARIKQIRINYSLAKSEILRFNNSVLVIQELASLSLFSSMQLPKQKKKQMKTGYKLFGFSWKNSFVLRPCCFKHLTSPTPNLCELGKRRQGTKDRAGKSSPGCPAQTGWACRELQHEKAWFWFKIMLSWVSALRCRIYPFWIAPSLLPEGFHGKAWRRPRVTPLLLPSHQNQTSTSKLE